MASPRPKPPFSSGAEHWYASVAVKICSSVIPRPVSLTSKRILDALLSALRSVAARVTAPRS
eukprot:1709773-Prymnesium_polylepis.1